MKRKLMAAGAVALLAMAWAADVAWAQRSRAFAERYPYMREASNQIASVYYRGTTTLEDAVVVARVACESLTRLKDDPNFERDLQAMERQRRDHGARARAILADVASFGRAFARIERDLLVDNGLPPPLIDDMLINAAGVRHQAWPERVSAKDIRASVASLAARVCAIRTELEQQKRDQDAQKAMQWIVYRFSGVLLIAADVAIGTAVPAAFIPIVLVSTALGVPIATSAAK